MFDMLEAFNLHHAAILYIFEEHVEDMEPHVDHKQIRRNGTRPTASWRNVGISPAEACRSHVANGLRQPLICLTLQFTHHMLKHI